jgi:hypothetical protein
LLSDLLHRMKTLYTTLLGMALLLAPAAVPAQDSAPAYKAEATTATRQLAGLISLDDARQLPVRRLTQLRLAQEAEVRQVYNNDPDMLRKKLTAIGQEYTLQLGTLLTPTQYQRYLNLAEGSLPASVAAVPAAARIAAAGPATAPKSTPAKAPAASAAPAAVRASKAAVRR